MSKTTVSISFNKKTLEKLNQFSEEEGLDNRSASLNLILTHYFRERSI